MSEFMQKDGSGKGYLARVTPEQRVTTLAVTEDISVHHVFDGGSYNLNTGTISLTTDGASGVLYLKNLENEPIVVTSFIYLLGNSDATGDTLVQITRNPTGGTLLTNTAQAPVNRDCGSNNTITATATKGAEGKTVTGGDVLIESLFASVGRKTIPVPVVLRKGNSLAISITPPSGSTSMNIQAAMAFYRATETTEVPTA
jgi:hypothetical protein